MVSFNLGGEKLKSFQFYFRILFLILLLITGFFSIVTPSFAQTAVDESTIFLDDYTPDSQLSDGGSSILLMLRMVLVLALAALAIYGVVFL